MSEPENEIWRPNEKQSRFIKIHWSIKEALYGGAVGGGKSELLMKLPLIYKFHEHSNFHGIYFRRTFKELEESIEPRAIPLYEAFGAKYNSGNHLFKFPSGARIRLSYLDEDKDAHGHDSAEYNYIAFDELTHFTEYQYLYLLHRNRSARKDLPAFTRAAATPLREGHFWVKKRFVDPCPQGNVILLDKLTGSKRIFIQAKLQDNLALMEAQPDYINTLLMLPEAEKKAKLYGDWDAVAGQVFSEFRVKRMLDEPENACHVCDPFEIPSWWPRVLAIDWGYAASTFALWCAIAPDGRVFIYREFEIKKTTIQTWGAMIWALSQGENLRAKVIDPSAKQNRGNEKTIFQQISEIIPGLECADNDRISGKTLIHEMLRWKKRPARYVPSGGYSEETAHKILRLHGTEAHAEYLKSFNPDEDVQVLPRLQIFSTCPRLIETLPICQYSEKRPEDVEDFVGDDPYDTLRYLLKTVDRYVHESKAEYERLQKLEEVHQVFEKNHDWNEFYRRMEHLEAGDRSGKRIRRFHRGRGQYSGII
jgi:hypothetical protein